jgi:GNAT superfamily N-acetyltransferase
MLIRSLRSTDVTAARGLLQQLGYAISEAALAERIDRVTASETHFAAVAEEGAAIVGLIHAFERAALEKPHAVLVQSLVVDETARQAGVGRLLLGVVEEWARERGLRHIVLYTRVEREDAHAFYERLGYQKLATADLLSKPIEGR